MNGTYLLSLPCSCSCASNATAPIKPAIVGATVLLQLLSAFRPPVVFPSPSGIIIIEDTAPPDFDMT